jgi:hypothetical protein
MIIKVRGDAVNFTTANTVNDSTIVRVYAAAASNVTITSANTDLSYSGSFTIPAGGVEIVEKQPSDTIAGTTTLSCTPVAIRT